MDAIDAVAFWAGAAGFFAGCLLSMAVARIFKPYLARLLLCALDEYEGENGRIIDQENPHWSVQARNLLGRDT